MLVLKYKKQLQEITSDWILGTNVYCKHCMSTPNSHAQDFETLINIEEFHMLTRTEHGM